MDIEVLSDAEAVARRGAELIAAEARKAMLARGRFALAVSGGTTPWRMLRILADEDVAWSAVDVFQVDERVAEATSPDRNLSHLRDALLDRVPVAPGNVHAMPVDALVRDAGEAAAGNAAATYAAALGRAAGTPPILDLVHLGLGADGHTASLVPGDPVLDIVDADVAVTRPYQGARRMTLTLPAIDRARRIVWIVTGAAKRLALARLLAGDQALPASRVATAQAVVLTDRDAAGA